MRRESIFRGAATALITPMDAQGGVDYTALGDIIEWQVESGVDALVMCGTTGEGSTLSDAESCAVERFTVEQVKGRVPIIMGTGSNNIAHVIEHTQAVAELGADAALVVTPYYNKATQDGLVACYSAIADASGIPVIIYNVPSRTGVNIQPETYGRLAEHPNIVAVKEADGNMTKLAETMRVLDGRLDVYSGNDSEIIPVLALGGAGVVSVLSNILPGETARLCRDWFEGRQADALQAQLKYMPLINALFSEVNPIPVKAAMSALGKCGERMRLPLTPMSAAPRAKLMALLRAEGLVGGDA